MKTKVIIFICIFFSIGMTAQVQITEETKYPETVIIKLQETYAPGINTPVGARMVTIDAANNIESKDLERSNIFSGGKEEFENNMRKFRIELQKWHNLGYEVKGITSASPSSGLIITTVILSKN